MIKRKTTYDIFLYLALLCLGMNYIMYNALGIDQFKTILRIIGISLMLAKWILSGKTKVTIMQALMLALSSMALVINGAESINLLALVIIGISMGEDEIGLEKVYKTNLLIFLIVLAFLATGIMHNSIWYGGTEIIRKTRWTLGFGNPNHATAFFTSFFCLFILTRKNLNKWHILFIFAAEVGVYYLTNSRTWFLAYTAFSVILFIMLYTNKIQNVLQAFCTTITDVFFAAHLFLRYILGFLMRFDVLLSFRISRFQSDLMGFGIKEYLFGGGSVSVDSMYINILYGYGILIYIVVWICVHIAMKNLRNKNNYKMLAFLVAMLIAGLMESSTIRPEFMSSIIVWNVILFNCQPRKVYLENTSEVSNA